MELKNARIFDMKMGAARRWLLPILVVVLVIGFPAVWFGPRYVSQWRQARLLERAREHLKNEEIESTAICLRRVLMLNPENVEATRALAELAEVYVPTEGLILRERLCVLVPDSYADAVAWARLALRMGQAGQADDAFELMKKSGQPNAEFHEIGGRVAMASLRLEEARAQFVRALEFDPMNESHQLNLSMVEIRLPDQDGRNRARETLERLRGNPKLRQAALRALVADRLDHGMIAEALGLAKDFVDDPEATFMDRLQYLAILRAMEDPAFKFTTSFNEQERISLSMLSDSRKRTFASYLNDLQAEAREDAAKVASLVAFLNGSGLSLLACEWTGTLDGEVVAIPPVAPAVAEAFRLTLDLRRLEELIAGRDWGNLEFMRCAYDSYVLRENGDRAGSPAQWATAIKLTEYRYERLVSLARMASAWGWEAERDEVLWLIARNSKRPREALEQLATIYGGKRDTAKLLSVWTRLLEIDPTDVTARKNWVRVSLLLGSDRFRAGALAQELQQEHPADPHIVASYAFVLHLRRQEKEALALMEKLKPEELRAPAVAGYYAIVLFANGREAEAAEFLQIARQAPLLREEQELLDQTRRAIEVSMKRR